MTLFSLGTHLILFQKVLIIFILEADMALTMPKLKAAPGQEARPNDKELIEIEKGG